MVIIFKGCFKCLFMNQKRCLRVIVKYSLTSQCPVLTKGAHNYRHHQDGNKALPFKKFLDFPGGAVVKNPPANAGDTGSSPGPGRSHVPRSN